MAFIAALLVAVSIAAWSYHPGLSRGAIRLAAIARVVGVAALLLLLLDPGVVARLRAPRPLVLIDNSVSMHATGGHAAEARALAATLGDTATFGELGPGEPGGRSNVEDALRGAAAGTRPVVIVSDGEIGDIGLVAPDVLARTSVRIVARDRGDDVAIVGATAPLRVTVGDTLAIDIDLAAVGSIPDSARVVVRDGERILVRGVARFAGASRTRTRLSVVVPAAFAGERWLEVARDGAADAEPGDDVRWLRLVVTATPGVVVLAEEPDWDARYLYRTLRDVVETPIRGYVQIERGRWRRMDDLSAVSAADVATAAARADLLAVRGDTVRWRQAARARLLWPVASNVGDWYLGTAGSSPLMGAFAGIDPDSLPPATATGSVGTGADWVGMTARLSRRGAEVPVVSGRVGASGRTVLVGADGLYRWAFRGGVSDQAWRTMVGDAAAWLLATPERTAGSARVVDAVIQRGRAVRFRWAAGGGASPLAITLASDSLNRSDTLRFDGAGLASLALPVGRYRYQLAGGGSGAFAVEPFSDELVPSPVTLAARTADRNPPDTRRSLRDMLALFAVALAGFGVEWLMRRKLGLV